MRRPTDGVCGWISVVLLALLAVVPPLQAAEKPKDRIDFWRSAYTELTPDIDPRVERVHEIFEQVLAAAGRRSGVNPKLFIVASDRDPLAIALPDGWVILSKGALEICYRDPEQGDARMAFVLGHEIAHQLKGDFWHWRFFQAIELSDDESAEAVLAEVREIAGSSNQVLAKELQADEHGIIYAAMAGFDPAVIVNHERGTNFFEYWSASLDPQRVHGLSGDASHPSPAQRAEAVRARLLQVLDEVVYFDVGVLYYEIGNFEMAVRAFERFLGFFPGREVYQNLAASHHQLALQHYRLWKKDEPGIAFVTSIAVDTSTRALNITMRGGAGSHEELFREHIERAIGYYEQANDLNPSYTLTYANLGAALVFAEEPYRAVGELKKGLKQAPEDAGLLNNLGIAFFYAENVEQAQASLAAAAAARPEWGTPAYNLGRLAMEQGKPDEAREHWDALLKTGAGVPYENLVRVALGSEGVPEASTTPSSGVEAIAGLEPGFFYDEIPDDWGKPIDTRPLYLSDYEMAYSRYENHVVVVSMDGEIQLVTTTRGFAGATQAGVSAGAPAAEVIVAYGSPTRVIEIAQGVSWVYEPTGLAIRMANGLVRAWTSFLD